jgi:hypothetical protein
MISWGIPPNDAVMRRINSGSVAADRNTGTTTVRPGASGTR